MKVNKENGNYVPTYYVENLSNYSGNKCGCLSNAKCTSTTCFNPTIMSHDPRGFNLLLQRCLLDPLAM